MSRGSQSGAGGRAAGPSQRQLRVGEQLRHVLAEVIARGDVQDPDLAGRVVTLPEVRMSPDLRLATVYVMPLGGIDPEGTVAALERNRRFFKGEVARRLRELRFSPDLRFRVDERFEEADKIDRLLRDPKVVRDVEAPRGEEP